MQRITLSVLVSYDVSWDSSHHNWMGFKLFYNDHLQKSSKFISYTDSISTSICPSASAYLIFIILLESVDFIHVLNNILCFYSEIKVSAHKK